MSLCVCVSVCTLQAEPLDLRTSKLKGGGGTFDARVSRAAVKGSLYDSYYSKMHVRLRVGAPRSRRLI